MVGQRGHLRSRLNVTLGSLAAICCDVSSDELGAASFEEALWPLDRHRILCWGLLRDDAAPHI